jgi:hypothetical protein
VGKALERSLTAGTEAIREETLHLQVELLCQLVEKIDGALSEYAAAGEAKGLLSVVDGVISLRVDGASEVTGVEVSGKGAQFKPGTIVTVDAKNVGTATGVKIK